MTATIIVLVYIVALGLGALAVALGIKAKKRANRERFRRRALYQAWHRALTPEQRQDPECLRYVLEYETGWSSYEDYRGPWEKSAEPDAEQKATSYRRSARA